MALEQLEANQSFQVIEFNPLQWASQEMEHRLLAQKALPRKLAVG